MPQVPQTHSSALSLDSFLLRTQKSASPLFKLTVDSTNNNSQKVSKSPKIETRNHKAEPGIQNIDSLIKKIESKIQSIESASIKDSVKKDTILQKTAVYSNFRFKDIITEQTSTEVPYKPLVSETSRIFQGHELKVAHNYPLTLNRENPTWEFIVLLFIVSAFTYVKFRYNKILKQIFAAFFNNSISNVIVRDENILLQRASLLLTVIFNLTVASFLYQLSIIYAWSNDYIGSGMGRFLVFAFGVSFVYFFKLIILKVNGFIFQSDRPFEAYIFNVFLINNVLGIILLPVVVTIAFINVGFQPLLIKIGLLLVILAFTYRLFRGALIGLSYSVFSIFYLFLYLCALEISPLLVLVKIIFM